MGQSGLILGFILSSELLKSEPVCENPTIWVPTRSDTNRPVQSQKQARSLKFRIEEEEGLYYPCSENKGTDQLRGYREADLRLCFRLCKLLVLSCGGSSVQVQWKRLKFTHGHRGQTDFDLCLCSSFRNPSDIIKLCCYEY